MARTLSDVEMARSERSHSWPLSGSDLTPQSSVKASYSGPDRSSVGQLRRIMKQPKLLRQASLEVFQEMRRKTMNPLMADTLAVIPDAPQLSENEGSARLSVLTLNVWVNKALEYSQAQVTSIQQYKPDVICLQEVFDVRVLEAYRRGFPDYELVAFGQGLTPIGTTVFIALMLIPPTCVFALIALIWFVWAALELWMLLLWLSLCLGHAYLCRKHYFVPFLLGNKTGLAMLVRTEGCLTHVDLECTQFSQPEGHAEDFLNIARPRGFLTLTGKLKLNNGSDLLPLRVVTTHLNQPPEQPPEKGRHRQVQEICDASIRDGELFILAGDLNATPPGTALGTTCTTYEDFTVHLQDAWLAKNEADPNKDGLTWDQKENPMCQTAMNSLFYGTDPLRWRCDFVLWRQNLPPQLHKFQTIVRSCDMVFVGSAAVSDHYGIFTVFDIKEQSS